VPLGARVAVSAQVHCRKCEACRSGASWDCSRVVSIGIGKQGSYAEFVAVPSSNLYAIPDDVSFEQAAAFAATGPLAYEQLRIGLAQADEWVLVPGASGSVGTMLVALATQIGAKVIALTRGRRATDLLGSLGAHHVLDTDDPKLSDSLLEVAPGGVHLVADNVGIPELFQRYWPAVTRHGRIIFAGRASSRREPLPIDVVELYRRAALISGLTIGDPRAAAAFWRQVQTRPVDLPKPGLTSFPLADAARAHARIEQGEKHGHFVLTNA
jgi:D-arabinose 1-dehydrogenase-like Zn-dependent alcohol dehydrogenase